MASSEDIEKGDGLSAECLRRVLSEQREDLPKILSGNREAANLSLEGRALAQKYIWTHILKLTSEYVHFDLLALF